MVDTLVFHTVRAAFAAGSFAVMLVVDTFGLRRDRPDGREDRPGWCARGQRLA